jgi:hypothetical protein
MTRVGLHAACCGRWIRCGCFCPPVVWNRPTIEASEHCGLGAVAQALLSAFPQEYLCNETSHGLLGFRRHLYYVRPLTDNECPPLCNHLSLFAP